MEELEVPAELEPFSDDRDNRLMPFRILTQEFLRGIETGTSPAPNFIDGYRCQQVLDAVRESSGDRLEDSNNRLSSPSAGMVR